MSVHVTKAMVYITVANAMWCTCACAYAITEYKGVDVWCFCVWAYIHMHQTSLIPELCSNAMTEVV